MFSTPLPFLSVVKLVSNKRQMLLHYFHSGSMPVGPGVHCAPSCIVFHAIQRMISDTGLYFSMFSYEKVQAFTVQPCRLDRVFI